MNSIEEPLHLLEIKDIELLKVFADPLRNQVLELLSSEPLTVNEISEKLGVPSSKLYYHINLLEKSGFIRVVDTTVKANLIEKNYWLSAYQFKVDESMLNFSTTEGQKRVTNSLVIPIETTREDILRSLSARAFALEKGVEAHPRGVIIYRELRRVSDETANRMMAKLKDLLHEFSALENQESGEDLHTRALTVVFYPSFYYESFPEKD